MITFKELLSLVQQKVKEGERKAKQRGVEIKRHLVKEKVSR